MTDLVRESARELALGEMAEDFKTESYITIALTEEGDVYSLGTDPGDYETEGTAETLAAYGILSMYVTVDDVSLKEFVEEVLEEVEDRADKIEKMSEGGD